MLEKIKATSTYIQEQTGYEAEVGIILGTGLGGLAKEIDIEHSLNYSDIPNFPVSTVEGHAGRLIFGHLGGKKIIAMQGRFHFYEGYSLQDVTFPVRVLRQLGVRKLIVSNASGGLNPEYKVGDIMMLTDHINMFPGNPLIGPNLEELGPRFPDMSEAYNLHLRNLARKIALKNDISLEEGVYVGVAGPTFETPAEYKMFRVLGGDAVGMSTVPEVIVARHMDIDVFGISIVTDSGVPGEIVEISHEEVQEVAMKAEPKLSLIIRELIRQM
ncbi:purine-nucleoside phosphorylase [Prolixibacter sp. NT017]|uniref:purine-nucleoside phosphorylase n=1 Tax=Prolixibacter sp. NT017 TaxID=2652390 RepID=UPI00126BD498|nr:purine-nucleoside phosphorylase [Prolixibacter sp. NT017]GET26951.1 purine nucleoside phosphorylase [Prolixibacter sp. NT017]